MNKTVVFPLATTFLKIFLISSLLMITALSRAQESCPLITKNIIAVGGSHSLALRNDGKIVAWGANGSGQLGDGTNLTKFNPVQVLVLDIHSRITELAGGSAHSMALLHNGTVYTWGSNTRGQLGNGTTTDSTIPIQVPGLTNVIAISGGSQHSMALKSDGTVWVWGFNDRGQLGNGTTADSLVPIQVPGLTNVIGISAGNNSFSLALKADGTVWGWGLNSTGQLGDGTVISPRLTPVQVKGPGGMGFLTNVTKIAAGAATSYSLKSDGTVWGWGFNANGRIGDGTTTQRNSPVQIVGPGGSGFLTDVIDLHAGGGQGFAVKLDGSLWAWGANGSGQLGDGTNIDKSTPVQITFKGKESAIATFAGGAHTLLALKNGKVLVWGSNSSGQLGNGEFAGKATPVQVSGLGVGSDVTAISASTTSAHSFAFKSDGTVLAWGANAFGKLGDNTMIPRFDPVLASVLNSINVSAVTAGGNHSLVLASDSTVWCWGLGASGQLGNNSTSNSATPVHVLGPGGVGFLTSVINIKGGFAHSIALKSDGTVWGWGSNNDGRVGDGTISPNRTTPVQVIGLTNITAISVGSNHNLALRSDGTVFAWGLNTNGQVGDGTTVNKPAAVQVFGLGAGSGVVALAADGDFSMALKSDGSVLTWGSNADGQLGDGTNVQQLTPMQVPSLGAGSGVSAIAAGGSTALALKSDGSLLAWGSNSSGQIGDGTLDKKVIPTPVSGIASGSGVIQIMGGSGYSLALKSDGTVLSWGTDVSGQLGDGPNSTTNLSPSEPILQVGAECE